MRSERRRGFTLIEMLLVVFILAVLAASTSALVDQAHEQARFDDNQARHAQLRRAILGGLDPSEPVYGFIADVGSSPRSIMDLIERPDWVGSYTTSRVNLDGDRITVGSGWRGPYLVAQRLPNGKRSFADGWGNPDRFEDDPNFGWIFEDLGDEERRITSLGADGAPGPAATSSIDFAVDDARTILRTDGFVDLRELTCDLTLLSDGDGQVDVALRVWFPRGLHDDGGGNLDFVDGAEHSVRVVEGSNPVQLSFLDPAAADAVWIPQGIRAIELRRHSGHRLEGEFALVELRPGRRLVRLNRMFKANP